MPSNLVYFKEDNFRIIRRKMGLTQEKFANLIGRGISQSDISELERGKAGCHVGRARKIVDLVKEYVPEGEDPWDYLVDSPPQINTHSDGEVGEPLPKISLENLAKTDNLLLGRDQELKEFDKAWNDQTTNIISVIGPGGNGKTALINRWLGRKKWKGAVSVFGWSFHRKGSRPIATPVGVFMEKALLWFGDSDPKVGSLWDKGERLANLVRKQRTLLILDGLEPLQNPPGSYDENQINDQSLAHFLINITADNQGLCILSSWFPIADIANFDDSIVKTIDLDNLKAKDGAKLLKKLEIVGLYDELKEASSEVHGHCLTLRLLGKYLYYVCDRDIRRRDEVQLLKADQEDDGQARKIIQAYEQWLSEPELAILRLLGLFSRPADSDSIKELRSKPAIADLTEEVIELSEEDWQWSVSRLRDYGLILPANPIEPDTLDAHAIIRVYYRQQLRKGFPDSWKQANKRLYEFCLRPWETNLPETREEMETLYMAMSHGCEAGLHQEALNDVYKSRIQRGDEYYAQYTLGSFNDDLDGLLKIKDRDAPKPVTPLDELDQAFITKEIGYCLRALGRLSEALIRLKEVLEAHEQHKRWKEAATVAGTISHISTTMGKLDDAHSYAKRSVSYADRASADHGGDDSQRLRERVILGIALHQMGNFEQSEGYFIEAEDLQEKVNPNRPLIYPLRSYKYCSLLLSIEKYQEAYERAATTIKWAEEDGVVINIALDHLSMGQALLLLSQRDGVEDKKVYAEVSNHFDLAVNGLKKAGRLDHLPRGYLARGNLRCILKDFDGAKTDLDEAFKISTSYSRDRMKLHEADCYLEFARLYHARYIQTANEDDLKNAHEMRRNASKMVKSMGYYRRNQEVDKLEKQLRKGD